MQTQMKPCQQPLSMVVRALPLSPPKRMPKGAPHARAALNLTLTPHAAVQEMSDLLDADLGRPALEVLTRLCDQGVRPVGVPVRDARTRRARSQVNPTALAAVVRELRKERDALAAAASQAGGEPPRR